MRKIHLLTLVAAFVATLTLPVGADEVFTPDKTSGPVGTTITFENTYCFAGSGGWARANIGKVPVVWAYTEATAEAGTGYVGDIQLTVPDNAEVGHADLWVTCEEGPDGPPPPGYTSPQQAFQVTPGGSGGGGGGGNGGGGDTGGGGTDVGGSDVGGSGADNSGDSADATGASAPAPAPVSAMPTFTG